MLGDDPAHAPARRLQSLHRPRLARSRLQHRHPDPRRRPVAVRAGASACSRPRSSRCSRGRAAVAVEHRYLGRQRPHRRALARRRPSDRHAGAVAIARRGPCASGLRNDEPRRQRGPARLCPQQVVRLGRRRERARWAPSRDRSCNRSGCGAAPSWPSPSWCWGSRHCSVGSSPGRWRRQRAAARALGRESRSRMRPSRVVEINAVNEALGVARDELAACARRRFAEASSSFVPPPMPRSSAPMNMTWRRIR